MQGKFFEAKVTEVLPAEKSIVACFPDDAGFPEACFKISYDVLVLGVGCVRARCHARFVRRAAPPETPPPPPPPPPVREQHVWHPGGGGEHQLFQVGGGRGAPAPAHQR